MADYAIGDVQGCYDALQRLLDKFKFDEQIDRLWFVGDLVNRGPQSLAVLHFVKSLKITPKITLGNHDLHLLNAIYAIAKRENFDDTLTPILNADDRYELGDWLRKQSILIHDQELNIVMCHAGIAPCWNLSQAKKYALELENTLQGHQFKNFLRHMYGNKPNYWLHNLAGMVRLRVICNYFTRMRFCDERGQLDLGYKGTVQQADKSLYPWFAVPKRKKIAPDIIFGHWAALEGICPIPNIHAIDTGCYWGGKLTALRLQDKQRFTVNG